MANRARSSDVTVEGRFAGLIGDLSAIGFRISPEIRLRALSMLLALAQDRQRRARLSSLLAPLLCHSVEEQAAFKPVLLLWFPDDRVPVEPEPDATPTVTQKTIVTPDPGRSASDPERGVSAQNAGLFYTFFAVVVVAWTLHAVHVNRIVGWVASVMGHPHQRFSVVGWLSQLEESAGLLGVLLWMLPIGFVAYLLSTSRKSLVAYARRLAVVPRSDLPATALGQPEQPERSAAFFREIQPLRQPITVESTEIDVGASIDRTIANGGAPEPVFATRRVSPDYRVLIEARGVDDHLASYAEQFVRELERASVNISTYWYDRSPQRLVSRETGRVLDYDDVVQDRVQSRLIVFGDGDAWVDERTGTVAAWAVRAGRPSRQLLFTSRDPCDWSHTERVLERQLGFAVFLASEAGLVAAAGTLGERAGGDGISPNGVPFRTASPAERLGDYLGASAWRWINEAPPPSDEVDELIAMLRNELSSGAFGWLVALAVFPTITWPLSVFLGRRLLPQHDPRGWDATMLEIARLPWLRYGTMPIWLRQRLIGAASPELRENAHRALNEILVPSVGGGGKAHFALQFALSHGDVTGDTEPRRPWQRDPILLEVMTKQDVRTTDFQVPTALARAMGLPLLLPLWHDVFGRSEFAMLRESAAELTTFLKDHPPRQVLAEKPASKQLGDALEPREWIERGDAAATPPRRILLYRRDPNQRVRRVIDDVSLNLYLLRKRVAIRAGLLGLVAVVLSLAFVDFDFSTMNVGVLTTVSAVLVYFPPFFYWFLFVRPFSKYIALFPTVSESIVRNTWRSAT